MFGLISKGKKKKYRKSISRQFAFSFYGVMIGTLALCWICNNLFLENYYIHSNCNTLITVYERLNDAERNGKMETEEFYNEIEELSEKYSLDILVFDPDTQDTKNTAKDPDVLRYVLWDHMFGHTELDNVGGKKNDSSADAGNSKVSNSSDVVINGERTKVLVRDDDYEICISTNMQTGTKYLDMWGNLSKGEVFVIRLAIESIHSSVAIANRFIGYIGIVELLVSGVIIILVSKKITEPILALSDISEKMANLDFSAKYNHDGDNEITFLGDNINKLSESLEKNISELKSANIALQKDIEKKVQIDEMRAEFLSNVSHELKTPIALIQGYAEGLQEGINNDPDSMSYYCEVICDEANKMNNMVKKLLTLNQLEFSNETVNVVRFDIIELIKNCVATTEILTMKSGITIGVPDNKEEFVWGDEFMAEEIFTNYLSNAINHCENEKRIDIKLTNRDDKLRITVFNTGKQIPEEAIGRVWEKFYKVDKARTRDYGGNGIGLSIVAAMCKSMNQNYGVENYDNGVAFWFELDRK